jgi:hypothetical protein
MLLAQFIFKTKLDFILNKQKCHFIFSYKIREQEVRTGPAWREEGLVHAGGGGMDQWEGEYLCK